MDKDFASTFNHPNLVTPTLWFKTKWFKILLTALGVIGVVLIVLFNQQIGDLLSWLASRAAVEVKDITLTFDQAGFPTSGYSAERWDPGSNTWVNDIDSVTVDNTNKLILNPH